MDKRKAREIMREYQNGFGKLNPRWCAIEELISDSEKLERIEQIVSNYESDKEPMYDTEDYMNSIIEVLEKE